MQSKMQVLSDLVATRNTIRRKFNRAYSDRMKRERIMREVLKPVSSAITDLKPSTATSNKKKAFTHNRGLRKKNRAGNGGSSFKTTISLDASSDSTSSPLLTADDDDDYDNFRPPHSTPGGLYTGTTPKVKSGERTPRKYTYEVEYDNQKIEQYNKPPDDNLKVFVTKTDKKTGEMTTGSTDWKSLPSSAKKQWTNDRKRIVDFINTSEDEKKKN